MTVTRLLVSYDGSAFSGFQVQPNRRTVQGVLEEALGTLLGGPVRVRGAGRTDAGVHALGQVASFETDGAVDTGTLLRRLAGLLPPDLSVLDVQTAPDTFDARRSARWRAYSYLVWNHEAPHPVFGRYAWWMRRPVHLVRLREALGVVEGEHDFRSFARVRDGQSPVRTIHEACAEAGDGLVRIRIAADGFLHQMVRSIVGSALEVATARRPAAWMREALVARDRAYAGPVAPAHGLTLTDVGYDDAPWPRRVSVGWPWSSYASIPTTVGATGTMSEIVGGLG